MAQAEIRPEFRRLSEWLSKARSGVRSMNSNPGFLAQVGSAWELLAANVGKLESEEAEQWAKKVLQIVREGSNMPAGGWPEVQKRLSREEKATLADLVRKLDKHVDDLYCNRRRR